METKVIDGKIQEFNGERFYLCGSYLQHKGRRLHRVVWEYHNGEIPKGHHVHHIDGNRLNNSIENLILVTAKDHMSHHMKSEDRKEQSRINIKKAIEKAPEWHGSEEGKKWHSEQSKDTWGKREPVEYECDYCQKKYKSLNISYTGNHFCSNNCREAFRRKSGIDNEERICALCGAVFTANKYSKHRFCSLMCARHSRKWRRDAVEG